MLYSWKFHLKLCSVKTEN